MWTCPICNAKVEYSEHLPEDDPYSGEFPITTYDYWCTQGAHLTQAISPGDVWQTLIVNDTGDELWGVECNTKWELIGICDWHASRKQASLTNDEERGDFQVGLEGTL